MTWMMTLTLMSVFANYGSNSSRRIKREVIEDCWRKRCSHSNFGVLLTKKCFSKKERATSMAASSDTVQFTQKSLERGYDFYFLGYVHDVNVCNSDSKCYVKSKCWASLQKHMEYTQKLCCQKCNKQMLVMK